MRILFLTQWFDPEPIFKGSAFAAALARGGRRVEVATAFPNYPGGKVYPGYRVKPYLRDKVGGVTTHRLWVWPSHDKSAVGRALNYLSFFASVLVFGLLRGRNYDLVYVYHPPITPAVAAALFCRIHRKPLVVEIQDLWPDSVSASGMAGGRISGILAGLCRFVYRRAIAIVPQSDGMRDVLAERGVPSDRMTRIYNWSTYTPPASDAYTALPEFVERAFAGQLNLVYGGNIGQAQALEDVVDAVSLAHAEQPEIHLHIFGGGIERDALARHVALHAADCVTLHEPVPRHLMDRIFDRADGLVLHLKDDPLYAITIPSKVQHYLSCGKPVIAGLSGEAAQLLERSGAALVVAPRDVGGLARAIGRWARMSGAQREALGQAGAVFYAANLDFPRAIEQTVDVITRAGLSRRGE